MHPGGIIVFNSDYIGEKKYGFMRTIAQHLAYKLEKKGLKLQGMKDKVDYSQPFTCDLAFNEYKLLENGEREKLYSYEHVDSIPLRDRLDYSELQADDVSDKSQNESATDINEKIDSLKKMVENKIDQNKKTMGDMKDLTNEN